MDKQTNRKHAKGCEMDQAHVVGSKILLETLWGGSYVSQHKPAASLSLIAMLGTVKGLGIRMCVCPNSFCYRLTFPGKKFLHIEAC